MGDNETVPQKVGRKGAARTPPTMDVGCKQPGLNNKIHAESKNQQKYPTRLI